MARLSLSDQVSAARVATFPSKQRPYSSGRRQQPYAFRTSSTPSKAIHAQSIKGLAILVHSIDRLLFSPAAPRCYYPLHATQTHQKQCTNDARAPARVRAKGEPYERWLNLLPSARPTSKFDFGALRSSSSRPKFLTLARLDSAILSPSSPRVPVPELDPAGSSAVGASSNPPFEASVDPAIGCRIQGKAPQVLNPRPAGLITAPAKPSATTSVVPGSPLNLIQIKGSEHSGQKTTASSATTSTRQHRTHGSHPQLQVSAVFSHLPPRSNQSVSQSDVSPMTSFPTSVGR